MPRAKKNRPKQGAQGGGVYRWFTDLARKFGPDTAIFATIIVLAFGALIRGADADTTFELAALFVAGWLIAKWVNLICEERREKIAIRKEARKREEQLMNYYNHDRESRRSLPKR